ncbi:MAG: hypothetical protein ACFE8U_12885 [Candidatus Hermodarchaeota archaeon]
MYPLLYAMRVNGDRRQLGKKAKYETTYTYPSNVVRFWIKGFPKCNNCGKDVKNFGDLTLIIIKYEKLVCKGMYEKILA